jgi:5-methylcytosine-specific restriction endonuclease McrA
VLVADFLRGKRVIWAGEVIHRGSVIRDALLIRRQYRRRRRSRHTRYRGRRFLNRRRTANWLPPSIQSRVANLIAWVARLRRWSPVSSLGMELVKVDTHAMQNPGISGIEYQQGTLAGYEVREYLLEKWQRQCAYCGETGVPLEVEHLIPKSRGGSNRVSNLTLACQICNQRKGRQTAAEFGYPHLQTQAKVSLADVAAVNSARWALYRALTASGLPNTVGTGGQTKFNRVRQGYPKTHWIDAACVGVSGEHVFLITHHQPLVIRATGHGSRQMCRTDRHGFPTRYRLRQKRHMGFQTGDIVKAVVPTGKYKGMHQGRVACRATGSFDIRTAAGKVAGIRHTCCRIVHRADGYEYTKGKGCIPPVPQGWL